MGKLNRLRKSMTTTNYEPARQRAMQAIDRISSLLDEANIARRIDEPVEQAVATFQCEVETPQSYMHFLDITADFTEHLFRCAPICARLLTPSQARDEAVALVNLAYRRLSTVPYKAALCDAFDQATPEEIPGAGMKTVLALVGEAFKDHCRESYCSSVFTRHIDTCDWQTRCEIVRALLEQYVEYLPSSPRGQRPCPQMLVDDIPDLLRTAMVVRQATRDGYAEAFLNTG